MALEDKSVATATGEAVDSVTAGGSVEDLATATFELSNAGGVLAGGLATGGTDVGLGVDTGDSAIGYT